MRVLKKPKKNPTFNEYFPEQVFSSSSNLEFMFDYVFKKAELNAKVLELFRSDPQDNDECKFSFEISFRDLYGEREVDDTIINSVFKQFAGDNKYDYLAYMLIRYQYKWKKLIDNVYAQIYNPIENYDRQEDTSLTYEGSENVTRNVDSDRKIKGTTADTRNDTSSANSSSQKNVFAFDSAEASPSDSDSGTTTATGTGSSNSTVDNSDTEKRTETEGHSFTDRKNVTASRIHGNVGVTTSQQMLESEVALRNKYDFFNTVYEDIVNTLLKPIY